jgi:molecular chaperone DnaK
MSWADIDDVLLAGGSTRMPMIQDMLERLTHRPPVTGINPDECVALGASLAAIFRHRPDHPAVATYRAAMTTRRAPDDPVTSPSGTSADGLGLSASDGGDPTVGTSAREGLPGVEVTDVASHPLGIIVLDGGMRERIVTIVPEFTALPCERRGRFAYAYDGMTAVRVEITEGHGEHRDEVMVIGEVVLDDLPPRPRGTAIEVVYRYTVNQLLEVDVTDVETQQTRRATITLRGSLDAGQMQAAQQRIDAANVY